ncbi:MAG TPA: hypothetical protein VH092_20795 [Urbifossiella sp.]|jgi:hypothetical protein|nr:hypothetical protein [Urbifossiella sp.]
MDRRAALGFACGLLFLCGCVHDGVSSIEKLLGLDDGKIAAPKVGPASIQTATRVNLLGKKILDQNTFTGLDPLFNTVNIKDAALFHRGPAQLYISEGLVEKCKSESELAAVLCSQLGQMMAEKRRAANVGKDKDGIQGVDLPGANGFESAKATEIARQDSPARPFTADEMNAELLARGLLRGAGFDPLELERVQPLLRQSDRGDAIRKQIAGSAPDPKWDR